MSFCINLIMHANKMTTDVENKMKYQAKINVLKCITCGISFIVICAYAATSPAQYQAASGLDAFSPDQYWEDDLHAYGPAVTWLVANGVSYQNLASEMTAISGTSPNTGTLTQRDFENLWPGDLNNAPLHTTVLTESELDFLGTRITIRQGTNTTGASTTVSMAWRNRTDIEVDTRGYPVVGTQMPPMAYDSYGMVSDIVNLTGTPGTYVLEMEYYEPALVYTHPDYTEERFANGGFLYLGWFEDPSNAAGGTTPDREWVNAIEGNSATGTLAVEMYQGSYDDFLVAYPSISTNLNDYLGSWGVDTTNNKVWAVLDHNSEFGVVPEPSSLPLLCMGLYIVLRRRFV